MERTPHQFVSADTEQNQATDAAAPAVPQDAPADFTFDGYAMSFDLPLALAVTRDEIVLLRAFLGKEIDAILFEQEKSEHGE